MALQSSMPTGARLMAAICGLFACIAMVYVLMAYLPEERLDRNENQLVWLFGIVGVLYGWYVLGKKASEEQGFGIFLGIRAAIGVTIWILFLLSLWHVIESIIDRDLVGARPIEAIWQLLERAMELGFLIMNPTLIGIFLGTGIVCGVMARRAAKIWD